MRSLLALRLEGGLPTHQRLGGMVMSAAAGARFSEGRDCISSFRPYGGCAVVLYENRDFWGAATNGGWPSWDFPYVGDAMNDKASSIRFY